MPIRRDARVLRLLVGRPRRANQRVCAPRHRRDQRVAFGLVPRQVCAVLAARAAPRPTRRAPRRGSVPGVALQQPRLQAALLAAHGDLQARAASGHDDQRRVAVDRRAGVRAAGHPNGRHGRKGRAERAQRLDEPGHAGGGGGIHGPERHGRCHARGLRAHVQPALADAGVRPRRPHAPHAGGGGVQAVARRAARWRDGRADGA